MQFKEFVPELVAMNKLKTASLILLAIILSSYLAFHSFSMWEKASVMSSDNSISLGPYAETAHWLSENLGPTETALVPMREVFVALAPQLRDRLLDYKSMWGSASVVLKADTTEAEVAKVRNHFVSFLKEDYQIRFVVRDWVDPFARRLFEAIANDDLMFLLHQVEIFPFIQRSGWGSQMTIFETIKFSTLFAIKFSSRPPNSFRSPSNTTIEFTPDGAVIQKAVEDVRFYVPLQATINASLQLNYFTMRIQPNVQNLTLIVVFYYDADGDGKYVLNTPDQPSPDYTKSVLFSGIQLGWATDKWYDIAQAIPNSNDPIVQISFIMQGSNTGTVTLADLIVYTEMISQVVFYEASNWLSQNLGQNDVAVAPATGLFYSANPSLKGKLIDYRSFWDASGIALQADTTEDDVLKVRSYFLEYLKSNPQVKYVVRDWISPLAERLYEASTSDELMMQLQQIKEIPFVLAGGWARIITIYEKMQYTRLLTMNFTSAPEQYFTLPSDASVVFDSNGVTIQKANTRVGFYLPLETDVDASRQAYLTMRLKLDVENVDLILGFYYDVNGDGTWSGYDIDNYFGVKLSQAQKGWVQGQWYDLVQSIPVAAAPIVQIAVIADAGTSGTISISNLVFYNR